jgi:diguanylate cyclase (GGDEF)-like protein
MAVLAVGTASYLDGGTSSPVLYLFVLPIAYASLAFTPWASSLCAATTLATAVFVVTTDSDIRFAQDGVVIFFGVLVGASMLSVASATNRAHREREEELIAEQIAVMASTDGLTGCAVHRVFLERFEVEVARSIRHLHPLSLMMIDVDRFKSVNDSYGHLVGDEVLAGIGEVLRTHARTFDLVGRLGGDEFGVLMPDTEPSSAVALAKRIREELPMTLEVPVTLSIGISGLDLSFPTAEHMIDEADFALYQVKGSGRDSVALRNREPLLREGSP